MELKRIELKFVGETVARRSSATTTTDGNRWWRCGTFQWSGKKILEKTVDSGIAWAIHGESIDETLIPD